MVNLVSKVLKSIWQTANSRVPLIKDKRMDNKIKHLVHLVKKLVENMQKNYQNKIWKKKLTDCLIFLIDFAPLKFPQFQKKGQNFILHSEAYYV